MKMDMPSLVDEKAAAFKDYRVRLTPRVYLLDPAGKILMRGTPDMLFDANLYAVMGKLEGKKKEKREYRVCPGYASYRSGYIDRDICGSCVSEPG